MAASASILERMRIAIDGTPLTVSTGGIRRYVEELTTALRDEFPEDEYTVVSDQLSPPRSAIDRRWWLWGLRREMERIGADLFHGTDFSVPYIPSRPSVMTLHDLSPWRLDTRNSTSERIRQRTPLLLRLGLATLVVTPSEAVRREAIRHFGLPGDRVLSVPLAASVNFRPTPTERTGRPYFLHVGTIETRKNLGVVVDAWKELRRTADVDLVLAGRVRDPLEAKGVCFTGPVDEGGLADLYGGAMAVVYPSLYEGFGLPVLEAMQSGVMVIASRDPAITEVAGGAALQVDASDGKGWLEAMKSALCEANRAAWRERGLLRAAEFSWRKTACRTREVYVEALRRR